MADGGSPALVEAEAEGSVSPQRLRKMLAYANRVFDLGDLLENVRDRRQSPQIATALVARIIVMLGLLRIRSFNALEPRLGEPQLQRALGTSPRPRKLCSVDTLIYSLQRMEPETTRRAVVDVVQKAERNKVFREGWHGAMRFVAIDGWEPFCSRARHCHACLTREVKDGKKTVTEYYHCFVVALLLDERTELVLDMEPVQSADVRNELGATVAGAEGELTAAKRLVQRLRKTYGGWIDVVVMDALYSNGPMLTVAKNAGFGVIAVLKKNTDEPLKDALALWLGKPPDKTLDDPKKKEHIELWDCPKIETLSTYKAPIRVVRGVVTKPKAVDVHTWCFAVTGKATRLSARQVLAAGRARWHLENTGFYQWVTYWQLGHVFTHGADALPALFFLFFLAFNLLQLFAYRQLRSHGRDRGKDVTRTIWRLVVEMIDDLARLDESLVWNSS